MNYAELSVSQASRAKTFSAAQTDAMAAYCQAEHDLKELQAENEKLREQMERLVTLLRVDCDIEASWDGLRRFWSIELTEGGCLMRDRACNAEVENAKLRELVRHLRECTRHNVCAVCEYADDACDFDYDLRELGIEVDA